MANKDLDILNMSDEDLAKLDPSMFENMSSTSEEETVDQNDPSSNVDEDEDNEDTDTQNSDSQETPETKDEDEEQDEDEKVDETAEGDKPTEAPTDAPSEAPKDSSKPEDQKAEESAVDYKAAYDKLTAPFKANGRDIAVKSVDDAIALMQMGANYNKKMAALKPNLKLMKLLENNGLLEESKLSFLIDLSKKNPDAINKLVSESGIDPLDLSAEKAGDYKPSSYTVNDKEIELDEVLDEIQDSPVYTKTLDIVSTKWDGQSKQVIANSPQLLKVINSHVETGIYDLINKEIESERVFGRLVGLSDIEAYRQVGDAIQARGGFNHLFQQQGQQTQPAPVIVQPAPKKQDDDKLREKKRAASSSKPVVPTQTKEDFNPLSLSDDEFNKLVNTQFL
jgi:hypothetical protein